MKNDDVSWLLGELGMPLFEEAEDGLVMPVALRSQGVSIAAAAAELMHLPSDDLQLTDAIAAARLGGRQSALLGPNAEGRSFRVLATPAPSGPPHIRLAVVPSSPEVVAHEGLVDIAASVSHEVANAVGSIRGWAELALDKQDGAVDLRHALALIRGAARSAEQAARSMLALARGEVRDEGERRSDLSEFTEELLHLLHLTAREARVNLESALEPGLTVRASRAQLFTIVFNLVKNAIEACRPGGLVEVRAERRDGRIRLRVRDTGEGLDAEARERLFERYYTTKENGTGLGLALVQSAARASDAEISLDSKPGQGTTFEVAFTPAEGLDGAPEHTDAKPTTTSTSADLAMRVLVVDDDHALREMLATALSLRGADVTSARSSEEALRAEGHFDIALIDMMLNGCRGDELLALLRQRGTVSAAMLVTGTVQKPRLVAGGEPDDWVRKPFEVAHLIERIRRTLERHRMLHDASTMARA